MNIFYQDNKKVLTLISGESINYNLSGLGTGWEYIYVGLGLSAFPSGNFTGSFNTGNIPSASLIYNIGAEYFAVSRNNITAIGLIDAPNQNDYSGLFGRSFYGITMPKKDVTGNASPGLPATGFKRFESFVPISGGFSFGPPLSGFSGSIGGNFQLEQSFDLSRNGFQVKLLSGVNPPQYTGTFSSNFTVNPDIPLFPFSASNDLCESGYNRLVKIRYAQRKLIDTNMYYRECRVMSEIVDLESVIKDNSFEDIYQKIKKMNDQSGISINSSHISPMDFSNFVIAWGEKNIGLKVHSVTIIAE
jgi:hypothetical protein